MKSIVPWHYGGPWGSGWLGVPRAMMVNPPPSVPLPFPKVAGYKTKRERLARTIAMAVTGIAAVVAILVISFGYVMVVLT